MEEIKSLVNQSQDKILIYNNVTELIKLNEILPIEEDDKEISKIPLLCIHDSGDEDIEEGKEFQSKSKSSSNKIDGLSSEEQKQTDNTTTTQPETNIQNDPTITDIISKIYQEFENLCIIDTNDALKVYIEFKNYCMN